MKDFRKLVVWEKAHGLTPTVPEITRMFPKNEIFGLRSQMRRCSISIPANIAEDAGLSLEETASRWLSLELSAFS
jgi:four helix bundle protein